MSDEQRAADDFFRRRAPALADDSLAYGEQDGKYFRYQYVSQTAPLTITEAEADRVDDGEKGKINFKLIQLIQSSSGNVENGRMTSTSKTYEVKNWSEALKNLDWV